MNIIDGHRMEFNIKANKYRLIAIINHYQKKLYIRFTGIRDNNVDASTIKLTGTMQIKPLKTKLDYQKTLRRVEELFDANPGTPEGDELEILGILVDHYEQTHYPIDLPDPVEAIKFRMEQMGMNQRDLTRLIGSKSRASEILNRKRPLSISQIRTLHDTLRIPDEVLLGQSR